MKKTLTLVASALFVASSFPYLATAAIGDTCTANNECNTAAGEYCDISAQVCAGSGGSTGGGGALNTQLLQRWQQDIIYFINFVLVPLLTAIAFIVFLWGVFKYFIYGADNDESRKEGRTFVLYGLLGFVIIFSLWGLVNVGVSLLNVGTGGRPGSLPYPAL